MYTVVLFVSGFVQMGAVVGYEDRVLSDKLCVAARDEVSCDSEMQVIVRPPSVSENVGCSGDLMT
jgi:hypothetical protein